MAKQMKVALMDDIKKMRMTQRDVPTPKAGEVLVELEYVGVCGSDLHYYEEGRIGDFVVEFPFVLGHEAGGTVAALGEGVESLAVGDRVALEPGITCGKCEFCKSGQYNLCPDVVFFATPPVDGVFQEYVAHPADLCFKLPDKVSTMEGALVEPLAVGFHAAMQGGARAGQTAVGAGTGCIGLCSIMALRAMGVNKIIALDTLAGRLATAGKVGALYTVNPAEEDSVAKVMELTGGRGVDLAIETSGSEKSMDALLHMCHKGGTAVMVGYSGSGDMKLPSSLITNNELTIRSVFRYRHVYPMIIDALEAGTIDVGPIVSNIFPLDDIQNAMDSCVANKADIIKAVIKIKE